MSLMNTGHCPNCVPTKRAWGNMIPRLTLQVLWATMNLDIRTTPHSSISSRNKTPSTFTQHPRCVNRIFNSIMFETLNRVTNMQNLVDTCAVEVQKAQLWRRVQQECLNHDVDIELKHLACVQLWMVGETTIPWIAVLYLVFEIAQQYNWHSPCSARWASSSLSYRHADQWKRGHAFLYQPCDVHASKHTINQRCPARLHIFTVS